MGFPSHAPLAFTPLLAKDEIEKPLNEIQILEVLNEVESVEADEVVKDAEEVGSVEVEQVWRLMRLNQCISESVKKQDNIMKFNSMISIRGSAHPSCAAKGAEEIDAAAVQVCFLVGNN